MARHNVFRDSAVHVLSAKCSTCIYRPGNLMNLCPGRREDMEAEALSNDGAIVCHQTLDGDNAICRGYFDVNRRRQPMLQVAERFGFLSEDEPPTGKDYANG